MGVQHYREKRDFTVTPEPKGGKRQKTGFSYVVQKHDASHLHYDFRLELDGVLLSWAVPKGPSLDPKVRRLAMQVEDHPIDYATFEGTIPEGEYGGGTVMVWDSGSWEPLEDPRKGYAKGHLRFALNGKKLRGAWHLVRTGKADEKKQGWLLFKSRDDEARSNGSIVDEQSTSAKTGRSMEQIARSNDSVWHSNRAAKTAARRTARMAGTPNGVASTAPGRAVPAARIDAALEELVKRGTRAALPLTVEPQRPVLVKRVPVGPAWGHELKYDGYRILARLENGAVTLSSRNGHPAVKWGEVIACAKLLRKGLAELGLESYVKTTGGKGLHVCLPIARRVSWEDAKEFCRGLTELIVRLKPEAYVATMSKARRTGKIFIDFFRNGRGATFIAPYSTRARDGAAVAMPLAWDELSSKLRADHFDVRNVMKRMARLSEDPWRDASSYQQILSAAALRAVVDSFEQ